MSSKPQPFMMAKPKFAFGGDKNAFETSTTSLADELEKADWSNGLSHKQKNKILHAANTNQYKAVERLAKKYGVSQKDASAFASSAMEDHEFASKARRHMHYEYQHKQEETESWLKLSEFDLGDDAVRSLRK